MKARKNFDTEKSINGMNNRSSTKESGPIDKTSPFICYGTTGGPAQIVQKEREKNFGRSYREGGTKHISVPQAINLKAATLFAAASGVPLVIHCAIHWSGTYFGNQFDFRRSNG